MDSPLIRPEVFAARRSQWLGELRLGLPPLLSWLAWLCAAATLLLFVALYLGHYTRHTSVMGELVPSTGLLRLQATEPGVISELRVGEGSIVKRGQTLMLIRVGQDSAAIGDTAAVVARSLSEQSDRLDRSSALADQAAARTMQELRDELDALSREQQLIEAQRSLRERQLAQSRQALARLAPLQASGVLARRQVEEYEQAVLAAEDALNETSLRLLAQQRRRREVSARLATQPAEDAARDAQGRGARSVLTQALAQTEAQHVLRVLAPLDGVVGGLAVQRGQSVDAGFRLLSLVPSGSELVAQLWVPGNAVGQIAPGDRVMLRVEAYPYRQHGRLTATIEQVADTALDAAAMAQIADRAPAYPAFRVTARLARPAPNLSLRASMGVVGELQLERRRLIQWLYAPLAGSREAGA